MPLISSLRCSQTTGVAAAVLRDCISSGSVGLCEHSDPETLKTTLAARQPRSPSESLWKSNNPTRRRDAARDWEEWTSTDCTTLHRLTPRPLLQKLFVVVCFSWVSLSEADFCAPVLSVASLRVLKPLIQTTQTNCVSYNLQLLSALYWVISRVAQRKQTPGPECIQCFAQNEFAPFESGNKTSYDTS